MLEAVRPFILFVLICFVSVAAKAQLAIISDPDGFVNLRAGKNVKSKIIGKLNTNDIVLYDGESDSQEWVQIFYNPTYSTKYSSLGDTQLPEKVHRYLKGFVHSSRIIPIDRLSKAIYKNGKYIIFNRLTGNRDTMIFSIKTKAFNVKLRKISKSNGGCTDCTKTFVDKIDSKKPWGVDGSLPKKEIHSIILSINNKNVQLPYESYSDIFEPNKSNAAVYFDKIGNTYLYMPNNSDGAGGYDIVWVINNGQLIKRYVDSID